MKQINLLIAAFTTVLMLCGAQMNAQETRQVDLSDEGIISIPEEHEPNGRFEFDISHMDFDSDSEMSQFFQSRCFENFVMRALPHENKVYMVVRGDKQPNWTVSDWNAHIAGQLAELPITK